MGDDKASPSRSAGSDRELLMAGHSDDIEDPPKLGQPPPSAYHSGREISRQTSSNLRNAGRSSSAKGPGNYNQAFYGFLSSWASKKFMSGCVILLPIAVTFYITWWFIRFFDGFFSPIYESLGIHVIGLGFVTSFVFIFLVGVFVSSWIGASVLSVGEWFIKRMPLVKHIYSASKQISAAISPAKYVNSTDHSGHLSWLKKYLGPKFNSCFSSRRDVLVPAQIYSAHPTYDTLKLAFDQNTQAFKEVAIIRHPRVGEYAFGFITSTLVLQADEGDEELCSIFVPTNHLYIGDIFLVNSKDVIRPSLSVREGIEIVVSGGMSMPQIITPGARTSSTHRVNI